MAATSPTPTASGGTLPKSVSWLLLIVIFGGLLVVISATTLGARAAQLSLVALLMAVVFADESKILPALTQLEKNVGGVQ